MTDFSPADSRPSAVPPSPAAAPSATGGLIDPHRIVDAIELVLKGQRDAVELAVITLLAQGHLLIEDVPGVGKTTLATALAKAIDTTVARIQFTPDLLPSDIVGVSIYRPQTSTFEFAPGPIFANIIVADEINRASPKTQSALLEAMQEEQVTVDGRTYRLKDPFMVIATQNPLEMEGTYPLPEAQRDRFMVRLSLGYPAYADEVAMLDSQELSDPLQALAPAATAQQVSALVAAARSLHAAEAIKQYIVDLADATRRLPGVRLGASPRSGIQLLRAAKAAALLAGRRYVVPDDVQHMLRYVWGHRLIQTGQTNRSTDELLHDLVGRVKVR